MVQRGGGGIFHRQHIHAIHASALYRVAFSLLAYFANGRGPLDGCAHAVLIIFDHPHHRQFPHFGQVERFVEVANVRRAVAHHADDGRIVVLVLERKSQAGCQRQVRAHNGVAAPKIFAHVGQVHRTALAARTACRLAQQFGHHHPGVHAHRQGNAMIAVGGDDMVLRLHSRRRAHAHGFLPNV